MFALAFLAVTGCKDKNGCLTNDENCILSSMKSPVVVISIGVSDFGNNTITVLDDRGRVDTFTSNSFASLKTGDTIK